ncbi:unnamed protein product [Mortierella alpina]
MAPNARVSFDADLMTQTVPCSVFPSNSATSFSAFSDCQSKPTLFSVSHDGFLYLLHADNSTGRKPLVSLNECFGIPADAKVTTHAASQDQTSNIYLAFSTGATVFVVQPTKPRDWTSVKTGDNLTSWLLTGKPKTKGIVNEILMAKEPDDTGYPCLSLGFTDAKNLKMAPITINLASKTWEEKLEYAARFGDMTNKRCCSYKFLSERQTQSAPAIFGFDSDDTVSLFLAGELVRGSFFSPGALSAFDIYTDPRYPGHPMLLLATTTGLYRGVIIDDMGIAWTRMIFDLVSNDPSFTSSKELRVVQTDKLLTVWTRNGSNDIVYQQFDLAAEGGLTPLTPAAVPLLTRQQGGGAFSVHLDPNTSSQHLFAVDDKSRLTHLSQDLKTRLWQQLPILVPSTGHNEDFVSFTSHINVADSNGNALAASTVLLCSSSPTDLAVNGEHLTVGPSGKNVTTDSRGNLTVIHRVNDISAVVLTVQDAPGEPSLLGQTYTLNPAMKVQEGLAKVTDAASLKNVTLPDGSKLLDGSTASPEKIAQAGATIGQLHQHLQLLPPDGSLRSASLNRVFTKNAPTDASSDDSTLWDFWHWCSQEVESIEDWAVRFVDDTAHWVITIGEQSFSFLLDCVTHVLKAVGWVLQQVVTDMDKIIQWVGFLFQWEDILSTHNSLVHVINNLFDVALTAFPEMEASVDGWFDNLKKNLPLLKTSDPSLTQTYDPTSASKYADGTEPIIAALNTPGSNWSSYQLEHGGVGDSLATANTSFSGESDSDNPFTDIWVQIVEPVWTDMKENLIKVLKDLADVTKGSQSFSLADIFTRVGSDLVSTMLDLLKDIVTAFIKLTKLVITTLKTVINAPLNIPLLSPFYKEKTGKDLTILDAISLLLAIPTTVICKILTGKNPSELSATSMPKNEYRMTLGSTRGLEDALTDGASGGITDQISSIIDEIRLSIPYAMFGVNMACAWWGSLSWEDPSSTWKGLVAHTVISIISAGLSFPDQHETRPALNWRMANWMLGLLLIPADLIPAPEAQGTVATVINITQIFPMGMSILDDYTATPAEYPNGTRASITANSADRVVGQAAKILSNMCLITYGQVEVQPVFEAVAFLAVAIKQHTQVVKMFLPEKEAVGLHGF